MQRLWLWFWLDKFINGFIYPVCSIECENGKNHKFECSVFSSSEFRPNISFSEETFHLYPCITPLRVLLLRRSNPDAWRVIDTFMDHDEDKDEATDCLPYKLFFPYLRSK